MISNNTIDSAIVQNMDKEKMDNEAKRSGNRAFEAVKPKCIAIIGAGPAGMTAAITAYNTLQRNNISPEKYRIIIFEANSEAGKKLKATGNGKCNFTNLNQKPDFYFSDDSEKVNRILNKFDEKSCIDFYKRIGIPFRERNGYCYPYSEDASEVRDCFVKKTESIAKFFYGKRIKHIFLPDSANGFRLVASDKEEFFADRVIVCCGGLSYQCFGSNGDGFFMAKELGLEVTDTYPALSGLTCSDKICKALDGVRIQAEITLACESTDPENKNEKVLYKEAGEIIFNNSGLSGIPVMNSSRLAINALNKGKKVKMLIDFAPDFSSDEVTEYLNSYKDLNEFAESNALLKKKVSDCFREYLIQFEGSMKKDEVFVRLKEMIKNLELEIKSYGGFDKAQVTQGGVSLKALNDSLESPKIKGLYFAGENVNVDGICGGYNLQWAYSSGCVAGENAAETMMVE